MSRKLNVVFDGRSISRRTLMGFGLAAAAGGLAAACGSSPAEPAGSSGSTAAPGSSTGVASSSSSAASSSSSGAGGATLAGPYSTIRTTAVSFIWAPYLVAEMNDYFKDEGLDVSGKVAGTGVSGNAVLSGDADFVIGAPTDALRAVMAQQPMTSFCCMVDTLATNIVITNSAFKAAGLTDSSDSVARAKAMKGLKLASTGVGGTPDLLIRRIASSLGGLDPSTDVDIVPIQGGGGPMLAAIQNDQTDGMAISSPISDQAIRELDMVYLFNMAEDPVPELVGFPYIVPSCRSDFLEKNQDDVAAYCRAIQRSLNFIQNKKDDFHDMLLQPFSELIDKETYDVAFENNYSIYSKTIGLSEDQFAQARQFTQDAYSVSGEDESAKKVATLQMSDVWNTDIAQAAAEAVGDKF